MSLSHIGGDYIATKDTQSRKWLITIMLPLLKGFTREKIKQELGKIKSIIYYCICEEIGLKEQSHHVHIFICCSSGTRFSTLKRHFPPARLDLCRGSVVENRNYVRKEGKYEHSKKKETNLIDTFEEFGEIPPERFGNTNNSMADLLDMIKDGYSNYDIIEACPEYMFRINDIEKARQTIREEKYKTTFRHIECTYIEGKTNTNKTRDVMETYGYENVFRVTSYGHTGSYDAYKGQDVLLLDEFRSGIKISELLVMLEGYPYEFPCRYNNKVCCVTKVYIISNVSLFDQYSEVQSTSPATFEAFLRRIGNVKIYKSKDDVLIFSSVEDYRKYKEETPFISVKDIPEYKQAEIPWDIERE